MNNAEQDAKIEAAYAQYFECLHAAYEADDAFQRELTRVYGTRASEKRYASFHKDRGVKNAEIAKLAADELKRIALGFARDLAKRANVEVIGGKVQR